MPTPTELREAVDSLAVLAAAELADVWATTGTAEQIRDALLDLLPDVTYTYTLAAATVAADWYDDLRDELNVDGRFSAIVAELDDLGTDELARWGTGPLFRSVPDLAAARMRVEGGLQLRVANGARDTIASSTFADRRARGWQRSAAGGCPFCVMLASRGAVYTRETVDFAAHDHCKCIAVPVFDGHPVPVRPYTPTSRTITDADRARVRAYLAQHHAG